MDNEILINLKKAVIEYDRKRAVDWANKAVEGKVDPITAIDAMTEAIRQVSDGSERDRSEKGGSHGQLRNPPNTTGSIYTRQIIGHLPA